MHSSAPKKPLLTKKDRRSIVLVPIFGVEIHDKLTRSFSTTATRSTQMANWISPASIAVNSLQSWLEPACRLSACTMLYATSTAAKWSRTLSYSMSNENEFRQPSQHNGAIHHAFSTKMQRLYESLGKTLNIPARSTRRTRPSCSWTAMRAGWGRTPRRGCQSS